MLGEISEARWAAEAGALAGRLAEQQPRKAALPPRTCVAAVLEVRENGAARLMGTGLGGAGGLGAREKTQG